MVRTYDAIVIGAGACGSTTAYFLRQEGLSVAVIEKGRVGQEASALPAAIIGPESSALRNPWLLEATSLSKTLYDRIIETVGEATQRKIGYGGQGLLTIARTEQETVLLRHRLSQLTRDNIDATLLDATAARAAEPALPDDVIQAVLTPLSRFLNVREYTQGVAAASRNLGVDIYEETAVDSLIWNGSKALGVQAGGHRFFSSTVINAAGAWAGKLDARMHHPVVPLHGQTMLLRQPVGGISHNVTRVGEWGYITLTGDGHVVVASTRDQWGYDKRMTPDGLKYLDRIIHSSMPCLAQCDIASLWSGLRSGTPDGLPTIGPDPRVCDGFFWATGHAYWGMSQIPATAKILANLVLGVTPPISIEQVKVDRFLSQAELENQSNTF